MSVVQRRRGGAVWSDPSVEQPSGDEGGWPVVLWSVCLGMAIGLLLWLGDGQLATPPLTDLDGWRGWATSLEPAVVTASLLRLGALGLAWYLAGVTSISVLARGLRAVRLAQLAATISVGPVKGLVQQVVGIGLATGVLAAVTPAGPPAAGVADRVVMVEVADGTPDPRSSGAPRGEIEGGSPLALPSDAAPTVAAAGDTVVGQKPPVPAPPAGQRTRVLVGAEEPQDTDVGVVRDARREHRVEPGDHFWAIAAAEVAAHLGRSGTEAEIRVHWAALLDANADRLVVSGNPDLLLPGQRIVLPRVRVIGS